MIKKWKNTYAEQATEMLEVSKEDVLEWSNGEVNNCSDEEVEHSLTDPNIFGNMEDFKMGHIELPIPVVNTQYLYGKRPILQGLLGLNRVDTLKIVNYAAYINVNKYSKNYKKIITMQEQSNLSNMGATDIEDYKIGAEAISALLKDDTNIVLRYIPVVPLCMRYVKNEKCKCYSSTQLEYLYFRVINRRNRLIRLVDSNAPEIIILNERRMLQEYVNDLINNGANGHPIMTEEGIPMNSLDYLHHLITKPYNPTCYELENEEEFTFSKEIIDIVKLYQENYNNALYDNEKLVDDFFEEVRPLVEKAIEKYFSDYNDYDLIPAAKQSVAKMMIKYIPTKDMVVNGICYTIENYIEKRIKFEEE